MQQLVRKIIVRTLIGLAIVVGVPAILLALVVLMVIRADEVSAEWDRKLEAELGHVADTGRPSDELFHRDFICFNKKHSSFTWCELENPIDSEKPGMVGYIRGSKTECRRTDVRYVVQSDSMCIKPSWLVISREVAQSDMPQARPFRPKAGETYFKISQRQP